MSSGAPTFPSSSSTASCTCAASPRVARIKRSARHLLSLINDILNYAKVESGTADLEIGTISLDGALLALETMLYPQLRSKGLTLEHSGCGALVLADPEKLQQILLSLTSNAIKFTTAGGVAVRCASTESTVTIEVADTGVGIPPSQLARIFEPFIQVSRSLSNVNHEGVGLGLAISRDLAHAMGGNITVTSTFGTGSKFTLSLPRALDSVSRAPVLVHDEQPGAYSS